MSSQEELTIFVNATPAFAPLAFYYGFLEPSQVRITFDETDSKSCCMIGGQTFLSATEALRPLLSLSQHDKSDSVQEWITFVEKRFTADATFPSLNTAVDELDDHLTFRTFLVDHQITAADISVWAALKGSLIAAGILKKNLHPHLSRWYSYVSSLEYITKAINSIADAKQAAARRAKSSTSSNFELGLPDAVLGKVVTRFPPEPSGYLHIGHAKAAIINQYFAKHYQGTLLLRFDDTNPTNERQEFQDSILDDLKWMGVKPDRISYTSDYFQQLYDMAVELILKEKAYADDTPKEELQAIRKAGLVPSKHRDMPKEETLAHFKEMLSGSEEGQRWCIRARIQWDSPNGAMRDPVIYRCNILPHHRTGATWKLYPNYDFACPVVDSLEGVTHALRSNEYRDRNPLYQWVLEALNLRNVIVCDFSRLNFTYTLLSKRKLRALIDDLKIVSGWDDPRFPTIRGIRRRGLVSEALQAFVLAQGPSQTLNLQEWDVIWTMNKKVIDPIVPRHVAILKDKSVKTTILGAKPAYVEEVPKHKKNAQLGMKRTHYAPEILLEQEDVQTFEDREEITLMDWGNAIVRGKPEGTVESLELDLHLEGDFKKTEKKVHWLAAPPCPLVDALLLDYDYLITKPKLEEDDSLESVVNRQSEFVQHAWVDSNVSNLKAGEIIQLERKGYYIIDKPFGVPTKRNDTDLVGDGVDRIELILIPDGRAKSVALKAGNRDIVN